MNSRAYLRALPLLLVGQAASAQWTQFGGPRRDFSCDPVRLRLDWPEAGPRRVWFRPLGDGYSGALVDQDSLYTLYREGIEEVIVCLNADSGRTRWEHRYAATIDEARFASRYGYGPRSTQLILGAQLISIGFNGRVTCCDKASGAVAWSVDLVDRFDAHLPRWGYSNSPIAFGDSIILPAGGPGAALVALDAVSGRTLWRRHDFENSYGSPVLVEIGGERQIVCLMAREVVGVNPETGDLLWQHDHEGQWLNNIPNPIWGTDHSLLVTSEGEAGTRCLRLDREGEKTRVREIWRTKRFRVVHRNVVRIGNVAYGSSGDFGPAAFTALDAHSGEVQWQDRAIPRCGLLRVGERLLMLAETGELLLASPGGGDLVVHARSDLLEEKAWTIPTLVGRRLYLRDRKTIMAVELP